ncbi:hypothetical protein [Sulfuracidifex tepidarius]|uniref:Uncharacterized protein n=1 Tax=Sulfuracidifex tepidarius TaxID=1294262 RepID=A0A510DXG7_9CREN|nr:hypothetical protein [Sulfuracidifex tepidarius]BBG24922.1 hypothetical protein IC006_2256 [Sulfuracidifex tepidarius]BBG27706.1 hypothetical protein IC007_2260 [Sulfuracidifex tepidarius]
MDSPNNRQFAGVQLYNEENLIERFDTELDLIGITNKRVIIVGENNVISVVPDTLRRIKIPDSDNNVIVAVVLFLILVCGYYIANSVYDMTKSTTSSVLIFFLFILVGSLIIYKLSKFIYYTEINRAVRISDQDGKIFNAILEVFNYVDVEKTKLEREVFDITRLFKH